jgi:hypothetical protein
VLQKKPKNKKPINCKYMNFILSVVIRNSSRSGIVPNTGEYVLKWVWWVFFSPDKTYR